MGTLARNLLILGLGFGLGACAMSLKSENKEQQSAFDPIKITRIYTGEDGRTHVEEVEVPLQTRGSGGALSEPVDVTQLMFRRTSPDYFLDWHNAPRRQYVITLSGEAEVELYDGTKVPLRPGTILLAEDTTGQGHISRGVGTEERISLFIPLAEH